MHPAPTLPDLPSITHQGLPVVTTELLAKAYGVEPKVIHDNHQGNRERFVQGVHYFRLSAGNLKAFKSYPDNSGVVDKTARHLTLWTERGAARHAKLISTDAAWGVFGRLEESYFQADRPVAAIVGAREVREASGIYGPLYKVARRIGLDPNQAALAANQAARKVTGVDVLALLEAPALTAPQQARLVTPTDIGRELGGRSAIAVNALLSDLGFQTGGRDGKDRAFWEPTAKGQPFAIWQDTGKRQGDGTPVRQLRWSADVIELLQAAAAVTA